MCTIYICCRNRAGFGSVAGGHELCLRRFVRTAARRSACYLCIYYMHIVCGFITHSPKLMLRVDTQSTHTHIAQRAHVADVEHETQYHTYHTNSGCFPICSEHRTNTAGKQPSHIYAHVYIHTYTICTYIFIICIYQVKHVFSLKHLRGIRRRTGEKR